MTRHGNKYDRYTKNSFRGRGNFRGQNNYNGNQRFQNYRKFNSRGGHQNSRVQLMAVEDGNTTETNRLTATSQPVCNCTQPTAQPSWQQAGMLGFQNRQQ